MSVAGRVQQLLDSHGHSLAEAEKISGVSRETIRRICLGHTPPKLRKYLRELAQGYGVDELALLEGASPKGEFEWNIRQTPPAQRLEWLIMSPAQRVKLTLTFLTKKYPTAISVATLAVACGKSELEMVSLLERWSTYPPDRMTALNLAQAIHSVTGICLSWFHRGRLAHEWSAPGQCLPRVSSYLRMNQTASTSNGVGALLKLVRTA